MSPRVLKLSSSQFCTGIACKSALRQGLQAMWRAGLGADPGLGCDSSMVTSAQAAAPKKPFLAHETWISELLLSPPEFLSLSAQLRTAFHGLQPRRLIFSTAFSKLLPFISVRNHVLQWMAYTVIITQK